MATAKAQLFQSAPISLEQLNPMEQILHALVIDNEQPLSDLYRTVLEGDGWHVTLATSAPDALALLSQQNWSIVFCNVRLGGGDEFSMLRRFKEELPNSRVVLIARQKDNPRVLDAASFGAYDYLLTPFGAEELQSLSATLREQLVQKPYRASTGRLGSIHPSQVDLVGRSHAFIEIMKQVNRVAATNLPVFLTGETGTGKELVAATLHRRSGRGQQSFVAVNCGAIPADMIESELFGDLRGSSPGTETQQRGLWEEGDGGTVFLDEITETSLSFQEKLLRVLQGGMVRRIGSDQMHRIDTRVIVSSSRDLEAEVKAGRFRDDLFYRLNAISITLPPLRERREDIPPLAQAFADRVFALRPRVRVSAEALALLQQYPWPGNVLELEHAVVRAAGACDGVIRIANLPAHIRNFKDETEPNEETDSGQEQSQSEMVSLDVIEGQHVARVIEHTGGNKQAAARILRVDRKTLDRMLKRHNIQFRRRLRNRKLTAGNVGQTVEP